MADAKSRRDAAPAKQLDAVYTKNFKINSPLWNARAKALMVTWIPHCVEQIQKFVAEQKSFTDAGISLIAVSTAGVAA